MNKILFKKVLRDVKEKKKANEITLRLQNKLKIEDNDNCYILENKITTEDYSKLINQSKN